MSRNIKNKVTGSLVNITEYDPITGEVTGITVESANLGPVANVTILGGTAGQFLQTDGSGNLSWANGGGGGGGNGSAIANGTSSVNIPTVNGAVVTTVNGTPAVTTSGVSTTFQGNILPATTLAYSLGSLSNQWKDLYLSGNTMYLANVPVSIGAGNTLTVGGNSVITANTPITGDIDTTGNVEANALIANSVTVSSANLGPVGNVKILGGSSGQLLRTDGTGNLTWVTGTSSTVPGGVNTQVQFNDNGSFGGDPNFTWNSVTDTLSASRISGSLTTAVQPNITTLGALTNVTSGGTVNFNTASNVVLGQVANIRIFGGTTGQVLTTNGAGGLSWANGGGGSPDRISNGTSNVSIPTADGPVLVGSNGVANVLVVSNTGATVTGNLSTGNATVTANLGAGNVAVTANLSAGNSSVSGNATVTGNVTAGNFVGRLANGNANISITANGNITLGSAGNTVTISGTGVNTAGNVTANVFTANSIVLNNNSVILGANTGAITPGAYVVSIGAFAAEEGSGNRSVSIGYSAGFYGANVVGDDTVAIGANAGAYDQNSNAIAIGADSGVYRQENDAIAIGKFAASGSNPEANSAQRTGAVAIGSRAASQGQGPFSIAIGANSGRDIANGTNQNNNSIVLNATGVDLNATIANTFIVKPVRDVAADSPMFYNSTTGEISRSTTGNIPANNVTASNTVSAGNATVTGNISAGNATITANLTVANANITGLTELANVLVTANANFDANLNANYIRVGNGLVTGNWTVQGNLVTTNQTSLEVQDPIISLGVQPNYKPYTSNDGLDRGLVAHTYNSNVVQDIISASANNNEITVANAVSLDLIGRPFYANAANGAPLFAENVTVANVDVANSLITTSANWLIAPTANDVVIIGDDVLEFMGYLNGSNLFVVAANVTNNNNSITVNQYGNFRANSVTVANITAVGNANVTGNLRATDTVFGNLGNFTGNVTVANLTSNANVVAGNANITGLITAVNANITTALTALDANVTGNLNVVGNTTTANIDTGTGNIDTNFITATGNVQTANLNVIGLANVSGNINGTANLSISANANVGGNLVVTGNATAANFVGPLANGASNVAIAVADGPVTVTSNGVTMGTFSNTAFTVGADLVVSNEANVVGNLAVQTNANIAGNANVVLELSGNTANFNQITVAGNVTVTSNGVVSLGNVGNVKILGGNVNQFLKTDGNGNLTFAGGGSGAPGGSNTSVQFNDDDGFGGDSLFTYDKTAGNVNLTGNVQGTDVLVNPGFPAGPNVSVTGIVKEPPYYVASEDTDWFLDNQRANMANIITVDGAYIVDGTLYDYYDANGNTEITGNLLVTGNITVGGNINLSSLTVANITSTAQLTANNANITGNLIRGRYNSGEVIRTIALQQTGFNQNTSTSVQGTQVLLGYYNYTPVSSNSRIYIKYSTNYSINAPSQTTSRWMGFIKINGGDYQRREQDFIPFNFTGSVLGTASGTAFPIEAVYNQTGGATANIGFAMQRITGDNTCTVNNDGTYPATVYIQEIQN